MQLSIGVSVLCLPWLRWAQPNLPRPIRVNLAFPVVYLIATVFVTVVPMIAEPVETGYGLLMILTSVPVYLLFIAWKNKPKWFQRSMGKCMNPPTQWSLNLFLNIFDHCCVVMKFSSERSAIISNELSPHFTQFLYTFAKFFFKKKTRFSLLGGFTQTLQKMMLVVRPKVTQAKVFDHFFFHSLHTVCIF